MNPEEQMAGQGQGLQMIQEIGQIVSENNQMLKEIGQMISQAMGGGEEQAAMEGGEEEALRQEAMARLAAAQGA